MKKLLALLPLLALLIGHAPPAKAQSYVYCNVSIALFCTPTTDPGNGAQGDLAWQAFGKLNTDITFLSPAWTLGANQLVGSQTAGTFGRITIGANLSLNAGVLSASGGSGGVTQLLAGTNITLSPTNGFGTVTITASSTAATAFSALTSSSNTQCAPCTIGTGGTLSAVGAGSINATTAPLSGITGLGTGVGTFLGTPSSANLLAALTTKTGTGNNVFGTSPTITGLTLGDVTGLVQCLHVSTAGIVTGSGSDCGSGGGGAVSSVSASGSNVTVSPTTGAVIVGFTTAPNFTTVNGVTIPNVTGTADILNQAQTITAFKTFLNGDIGILGSGTGFTTLSSANSTATNFAITFPAANDTVALLAATQTFTNKNIAATEVNSGTMAAAQMPALTGDTTTTVGTVATVTKGARTQWAHVTTSTVLSATNTSVIVDSGTGPITLPAGASDAHVYCVSVGPGNTSTVSLQTTSGGTIQGLTSPVNLSGEGNTWCMNSDPSGNWTI